MSYYDGDGRLILTPEEIGLLGSTGAAGAGGSGTPRPPTGAGTGAADTTMHPTMTAQSGFRWGANMPGKGQFQDIPNTGPSDWRGVPFMQTDTSKGPLSSYYNVVDQYAASRNDRNPLQSEGNFNRWNFGGPNTPADPRWTATHRGLLTGDPWRSPGPVNAPPLPTPGNGTGVGTGPGGILGGTTPVPNPTPPPPQGGGGGIGGGYQPPVPGNPPGAPGFGPFPPGQQPQYPIPTGAGQTANFQATPGKLGRFGGHDSTVIQGITPYTNPQTWAQFQALTGPQRQAYQLGNTQGYFGLLAQKNQAMKDSGYGPGAPTYSPFAPGEVGAK